MIELIKDKKGIKIAKLYQFVSDNFVNYYVFSKAHMKKNNFLNDGSTQNSNKDNSKSILNNTEQNNGSGEEKNF
jgi:hypothetical protein